jgi:ankyrin repeat protein
MELQKSAVDGRTCLEKVILFGHNACVSLLVGPKYRFRCTIGHVRQAAQLGRVGALHTLLQARPLLLTAGSWNAKYGMRSCLHFSITICQPGKQEHLEFLWCLINLLVEHKLFDMLQSNDHGGKSPLALAVQEKNFLLAAVLDDPLLTCRTVQDINTLLASGKCKSAALAAGRPKPPKGWTALHTACCLGRLEIVQYLLQQPSVDVAAATANGMTAMHWAARHGHTFIVQELLAAAHFRQTPKTTTTVASKMTPLHHAARSGHVEIVQCLLDSGRYDVNAMDEEDGQTPLYMATAAGQASAVSILVSAAGIALDCGITHPRRVHETCLQRATLDQREDIVAILLEAGAQVAIVAHAENGGETALHYAASCSCGSQPGVAILKKLMDHSSNGADPNLLFDLMHCAVDAHEDELLWQPGPTLEFPALDFLVRQGAALTTDTGQTLLERAQHPTIRLYLEALRDAAEERGHGML